MERCIPYEKALEILDKIDDSYFSEEVTSDYKLLDEVWQMLDLARSMIYNGLLTCGPEGPEGGLKPGQVVLRNSCGGCMVCDEVEVRIPEAAFEISVGGGGRPMSLWSTCEICGRDIPEGELCYGLSNGGSICRDCCTGIENTDDATGPGLRWMDARKHPLPKGRIVLVCGARGYRAAFRRADGSIRAVGTRYNLERVEYWAEFNDALGHPTALPWGTRVTKRFTPEQAREIREEWERHTREYGTVSQLKDELAKKYGASVRTIQDLVHGHTYKDV